MQINGTRVYLEKFGFNHLHNPAYFQWLNDYEVVRYIGRNELLKGISFKEIESYVNNLWENERCSFFAVHDLGTQKFIGTSKISFNTSAALKQGIADIGVMLGDRTYWGQGLASDILRTVSIYAFDQLKARKLTAGGYSVNQAVIKAFLRIGYRVEGVLRKQLLIQGGYSDHILMGCFNDELVRKSDLRFGDDSGL
jgi:ribosomal-protein-alanine N-acetyltransferase